MKQYLFSEELTHNIEAILRRHNPSKKPDLEEYVCLEDEKCQLWAQPYDCESDEIAKELTDSESLRDTQYLVHRIFVSYMEYTVDDLGEDAKEHHTFPGAAGRPEDYKEIAEEIYALKEKSESQ